MTERLESRLAEQFRALMRAARVGRQRLAGQAAEVQPGTLGILAAIESAADGCHPKELAAKCALDASTISRAVAALVARGLVQRTADPADRRACILALTDAGRAALTDLERQQADLLAGALRNWSAPEIDAFAAALTRFVDDATAYLDRTSSASSAPAAPPGTHNPSDHETSTLEEAL